MSEIRDILLETTNKVMKDLCDKQLINEVEKGNWPGKLWDSLEEIGITGISVPEDKQGSGGTLGDALSVLRIAGRYAAPVPLSETLMAKWILTSCGISFPQGPLTCVTPCHNNFIRFSKEYDEWKISGVAKQVAWGRFAKGVVVVGYSDDRLVAALLHEGSYTVNYGENLAGEPLDELIFNNAEIGVENVRYVPSEIDDSVLLLRGALTRVALMSGGLERILELTVQYANERTQFGRPIGRFQAVQQQLAILAGEVTASGIATDIAIAKSEDSDAFEETAIAKVRLGQAVRIAAPIAHQVHGAIGFTDEHALHQSTRRLWAWREEYGNEREWADQLGQLVVLNGAESLWPFVTGSR